MRRTPRTEMIGVLDEKRSTAPRSTLLAAVILLAVFIVGIIVAYSLTHSAGTVELPGPRGAEQTTDQPAVISLN